jgi:tRNA(fMet)-specific endonuclease VapC
MYVLDTNTLIYFFKGMGMVPERILATPPGEIGIPVIVLYELEVGIAKSTSPAKRRQQLKEFVSVVNLLPFTESEAKIAASIRVALEKRGAPLGPLDALIAGIALACKGILVTHNTKEFGRVPDLKVEDWY